MPVLFGTDDVLFGADHVVFGEGDSSEAGPPASPGTSPIALYWGGTEVGALGWNCSFELVLGAVSRATVTIQDRAMSDWEPQPHVDVKAVRRSTGTVLWRGESLVPHGSLPLGLRGENRIRFWTIPCRTWDGFIREALFGAPDGGNFWRPNDREPYRPIDPYAISNATDDLTVQNWIDRYRPYAGGTAIDTATFVFEHDMVPGWVVQKYDDMSTLGAAFDEVASQGTVNIQDWLDPDHAWHHQEVPNAVDLLADGDLGAELETCPVSIGPSGNGHHKGLEWDYDGQPMVEQVYLQGATPFMHEDDKDDAAGATGFYPEDPDNPNVAQTQDPTKRQAYLPAPSAATRARAIAVARSALQRGISPTLRMTFALDVEGGTDGIRPGQIMTINDDGLPPSLQGSHKFVVQRVAANIAEGTDILRYQVDVGDGPVSRANQGGAPAAGPALTPPPVKKPITTWEIHWVDDDGNPDPSPIGAGETRNALVNTANALGEQHQPEGIEITLDVIAVDADPASATFGTIIADQGSFDPNPVTTDQDGRARSVFTAGDQEGLFYKPSATSPLPQVS